MILVYVDDIILTGSDSVFISHLIKHLSTRFVMKDVGNLHYFLGIEVTHTQDGLFLSQAKYASEILANADMTDCKASASPISSKQPLNPSDPLFEDGTFLRSLVGSLQDLTLTRPKIPFSVYLVCHHMHKPIVSHFGDVKRLLKYVKGAMTHGLHFTSGALSLTAYTDADWAGDPFDRRSTSGFVIFLGTNPVFWCAKKQPTIATRSSTEAEYRAMA